MPLPLTVTDGDFTPFISYNAKAGRFYVKIQGEQHPVEVNNPRLAFDMANIKTGWLFYQEGAGPEKVWDTGGVMGPRPAGPQKWKRGFEVMVFGADKLPGIGALGLREFSSTASNVISRILLMYEDYEKGMAVNPGKVPIYSCVRVIPIQGAYGTNYEPEFHLTGWVDRVRVPAFDEYQRGMAAQPPRQATQPQSARAHAPEPVSDPFADVRPTIQNLGNVSNAGNAPSRNEPPPFDDSILF